MKNLLKIHNLTFLLLLIASSVLAEPSAQGSEEVLAHKPITGHDQKSKMQFMVYESVRNKGFETAKQFSKMTFYIAPFFRLIPNRIGEPYDRLEIEEENVVYYTFTIECFADRIEQQALATINAFYAQSTDGKYQFSRSQIQPMSHGMVVITPSNLPTRLANAIRPAVKPADENSPIHTTFLLGATARFTILVPTEHDNVFKKILDKQGLDFTFRVYFNVMKLQVKQILWDAEDIRKTQAYRELMGKGERYFDAKQINKVVREAARKVGVFDYADPGVEGKLDSKVRDVFNQLTEGIQKIGLATMADASALEERILQHSGLELTDYQPITLMWEVSRELEQARDYKEANEKVKDTSRRLKNALEKAQKNDRRKKKSLSVSGKAEVSLPIPLVNIKGSVSVKNYSRSSDVAKSTQEAIEQLNDQTNKDLFKNNTELAQFKKNREQRHGKELVIEGRGLNLVEKGHLEQNLSMLGDYLAVRPLSEARTFTTSSSTPLLGRTHCLAESENNRFQDLLKDNGVLGPKMVVIPAGDLVTKHNRFTFSQPFGISQYEITFTEYDHFCESTGHQKPEDAGWGRGDQPVINVTWEQANAYANWLSAQTGYRYRLPTEAQWEYALRAGSDTRYFFGNQNRALCDYGNGADRLSRYPWRNVRCTDGYANKTAPIGAFKPNRWQVYDLTGNVWEWTCSAYDFKSEQQISNQCDATLDDSKNPEDINIVIRGGSWNSEPRYLQSSHRDWTSITNYNDTIGIRLVREIAID